MLCVHLEGWDRECEREMQEGGNIVIYVICIVDSLCYKAETNTQITDSLCYKADIVTPL